MNQLFKIESRGINKNNNGLMIRHKPHSQGYSPHHSNPVNMFIVKDKSNQCLFDDSHSNRLEVILLCGFNSHFPDD